jgi:hypothetical protein
VARHRVARRAGRLPEGTAVPPSTARCGTRPALAGRLAVVLLTVLGSVLPAVLLPAAVPAPAVASPAASAPAPSASARAGTGGGCVGLVVDRGDGTVRTGCVAFRAGLSGQQVLQQAGVRLAFDRSGFICRLDGYPATCRSDTTHYWSYYHRAAGAAAGAWAYSELGAASYRVHPGETEGWRYVHGEQHAPAPKAVAYPQLAAGPSAPTAPGPATAPATGTAGGGNSGGGLSGVAVAGIVVVVLLVAGAAWQVARRRRAG